MARVLLIMNPAAARTRAPAVTAVLDTLRSAGWQAEVLATGGPGDARRLAEAGVRDGVDVVAVFGGDGTTMQAAAALVGTDVALGLIPGGTGNLLAGNLRVPTNPARAAAALVRGRQRPFDLGHMQRADGEHYFAVACGCGYDARVMTETASEAKRRWGIGAYMATVWRLMPELRSVRHLITVDGVEYEANAAMLLVANCGEIIPPFVRLRPEVAPDDGILDVVVLRANNAAESARAIWQAVRNRAPAIPEEALVGYARGREIRVESFPPQPVQLDGEGGGATPFTARIVPGAVRIVVP
ncbi:MAG TPA: diacylglycerol kinase family protein [Gemmatimonadales bacterium]|nr:diacylglycerol kinase family protein [Gemmatimonadales bacterium]